MPVTRHWEVSLAAFHPSLSYPTSSAALACTVRTGHHLPTSGGLGHCQIQMHQLQYLGNCPQRGQLPFPSAQGGLLHQSTHRGFSPHGNKPGPPLSLRRYQKANLELIYHSPIL